MLDRKLQSRYFGMKFSLYYACTRYLYQPAPIDSPGENLVRPNPETRQCVGAERTADRDVRRVAAARYEYPADARKIIARVEGVPMAVEEGLEPGSEIRLAVWR